MKVISFNIGIKIDNSADVVKYLQSSNADIVCLQEAVRPLESSVPSIYRSEEIIRKSLEKDYPHCFFAPEWVVDKTYGENGIIGRDFGGMVEQGKLILSKYPIVHGYDYFYFKTYEFDRDRTNFYKGNDHSRSLQVCEIDVNGTVIQIGNVHGFHSKDKLDTERTIMQSNFIVEKLTLKNLPTILLGDFNLAPNTKSINILNEEYSNMNNTFNITRTRSEGREMVDFIFVNKAVSARSLSLDKTDISDHYPLTLEVEVS